MGEGEIIMNDQAAMAELIGLPEIGPVTARQLIAVGITSADELRAVGAKEALLRIRAECDPGACLNMLTGLEAATRGVRANALDPAVKADLLAWFRRL